MREISRLATVDAHPAPLGRDALIPLLAHLERRLGDLLARRLRLARVGIEIELAWRVGVVAVAGIEPRSRAEDGSDADEGESESLDLRKRRPS